jgi:hypothetical protein
MSATEPDFTFLQSDPRNEFRVLQFEALDLTSLTSPCSLAELSSIVVYLVKNSGLPALITPTITEDGVANGKGVFDLRLAVGDLDTPGTGSVIITSSGGTKTMLRTVIPFTVTAAFFATASGTPTTASLTTNRTEANGFWNGAGLKGLTGANAGAFRKIGGYLNSGGTFTPKSGETFAAAAAAGDIFRIING